MDRHDTSNAQQPAPRRRETSSSLPGDPRGDTGATAVSTIPPGSGVNDHPSKTSTNTSSSSTSSTPNNPDTSKARPHRRSKRRKAKALLKRWKSLSFRHTWLNPLIVITFTLAFYSLNPGPQNPLHPAIFLSYPLPEKVSAVRDGTPTTHYGKGARDFLFVAFYMVVLSFTREFLMQRVIRPIAVHYLPNSRAKQARFMEQFYTAIYFAFFGPYGLYVMSRTPVWYFNARGMFENFPHKSHEAAFKAYYLLQASYWAQQAVVLLLQLEKPRKDFKELVGHHVITLALIWLSYRFHFTYMGLAVYITHDISDFFLAVSPYANIISFSHTPSAHDLTNMPASYPNPQTTTYTRALPQTSKLLNYLSSPLVGPYFTLFIFIWAYLRHYLNLRILYATLTTFRTVGPFELNWVTQQYKCRLSQYITFGLLASLQSVNLFWFFLILRIAKNYVFHEHLDDERSQYGSEDGEAEGAGAGGGKEAGEKTKGGKKAGGETTDEKRRRMGIETPAEAKSLLTNGNESNTTPTSRSIPPELLINGEPPELVSESQPQNSGTPSPRKRSLRRRG
ncbi:MAG: hypothetical protein M1831_004260 [Alyxoria varia]|nr:MAG: hypothetical protein M1831_004260 [Alyxoria varia]